MQRAIRIASTSARCACANLRGSTQAVQCTAAVPHRWKHDINRPDSSARHQRRSRRSEHDDPERQYSEDDSVEALDELSRDPLAVGSAARGTGDVEQIEKADDPFAAGAASEDDGSGVSVRQKRRTQKVLREESFDSGLAPQQEATAAAEAVAVDDEAEARKVSAELHSFETTRALIQKHLSTLRRLDSLALEASRGSAAAVPGIAKIDIEAGFDPSVAATDNKALPEPGPPVDYCVFCYHGTYGLLRPENTALLSRFVSERGAILPKRFTKCCSKHQRKLASTIRTARNLNLIPFHSKLHPRLRFGSLQPEAPESVKALLQNKAAVEQAKAAMARSAVA